MKEKAEKEGIIKSKIKFYINISYSFNIRKLKNSKWNSRIRPRTENNYYLIIRNRLFNFINE